MPNASGGRTLMTRHSIPLGRIFGIPIGLDYSWFVIFALLTWMFADSYYPDEFKHWSPLLYWLTGAVTAIMLFVSVLLHELGHSVVALRYKIPVRSITLFLFGGIAQIGAEPPSAIAEFFYCDRGAARQSRPGGLFLRGAATGCWRGAPAGFGQVSGLHQYGLGAVQPDTRISTRWWSRLTSHRLGDYRKHGLVDPHRGKRRSVFCLLTHLCRYLADVQRQFWWALGCVDRLVPGQRGFHPDTADDVSGSTDWPSRFASHEYALRHYSGRPDAPAIGRRADPR